MKTYHIQPYLTEQNLKGVLEFIFDDCNIQSQVTLKKDSYNKEIYDFESIKSFRVDYLIETPNHGTYIIEFNGQQHYTKTERIMRDCDLKSLCKNNDFILIEIPYFVQLTNEIIYRLFDDNFYNHYMKNKKITTEYTSGFHEKNIVYPYDFCFLGLQRFIQDYMFLFDDKIIKEEILDDKNKPYKHGEDVFYSFQPIGSCKLKDMSKLFFNVTQDYDNQQLIQITDLILDPEDTYNFQMA
jgi:hypothetical protein